MNAKEAFETVLQKDEDDTTTRMVYADWLDEHDQPEEADRQRKWPAAKKWLQAYAANISIYDPPDVAYDNLIEGLKTNEIFAHGTDLHDLDQLEDADDLKYHASIFLGIPVDLERFSFSCSCFSCSC